MNKKVKRIFKSAVQITMISIITASLTGCYFYPKEEEVLAPPLLETEEVTYNTVAVKVGNIQNDVDVTADLVSASQKEEFFTEKAGTIKQVYVKVGDNVKKGDLLAELKTDSLENDIEQQKINTRISELDYESKKNNPQSNKYDIERSALYLKSNQMKLDNMMKDLKDSKLYSEIDGKIIFIDANAAPGKWVDVNRTIIIVADPTQVQVVYKGDDASKFKVGAEVNVQYAKKDYVGEVVMSPENYPPTADKSMLNSVTIKVKDLPPTAKSGERAYVTLVLDKRENVIVIAKSLVNNFNGRNYVQVLENGMKYERDVELGLQTNTEVEITSGLKEGEQIIRR